MEWQQPNQPNNSMGDYSYLPFYQQDPSQANYNYDDDDEGWDEDEDEGYPDQNAYYQYAEQNMKAEARIDVAGVEGAGETPQESIPGFSSIQITKQSLQEQEAVIQNKAAILKAKILEKRASSRGVNKAGIEENTSGYAKPDVDRHESDFAIDKLVREARAAAEAQAKQKDRPNDETLPLRKSPVEPTPAPTSVDMTVQNSSKARKGNSQNSSKYAKNAAKAEARIQQQKESVVIGDKKVVPIPKSNSPTKQAAAQNTYQTPNLAANADSIVNAATMEVQDPRAEKKDPTTTYSRVEDIKNSYANIPSRSETLLSTSTLQQEPSTALVPVATSSDVEHDSIAAYSHHFDDLDEWLEVTGYHDRGNREKTLSLHRRKAQLEREMAEIDRELEQTASTRSRVIRTQPLLAARRTSSTASMRPPPTPLTTAVAGAQLASQTMANARSGAKRPRSPERLSESQHADKHQRTDSASKTPKANSTDRSATSVQTLEIPFGPRHKDVSPGLNIRGAEKSTPGHKVGQFKNDFFRDRARSFSPTARRASVNDNHRSHTVRGRFATREPSPKRSLATAHRSRSPIPSARNAYRPAIYEQNRLTTSDHNASYRGRPFSGSRVGGGHVFNQGRVDANASTSSLGLGLQRGDCRYFMIKSWNHDNVEAALHECTWATQVQNEDMFAEAYTNSRHVIFFFSVNNSKAFQGYARMESLPGVAPTPSWVKNLRWPSSQPFYIRWITTAETRFSRVGHLKNALNEGQAVLVGRDGQEIEEQCGAALCEAIDEESKWNGSGGGGGGEVIF